MKTFKGEGGPLLKDVEDLSKIVDEGLLTCEQFEEGVLRLAENASEAGVRINNLSGILACFKELENEGVLGHDAYQKLSNILVKGCTLSEGGQAAKPHSTAQSAKAGAVQEKRPNNSGAGNAKSSQKKETAWKSPELEKLENKREKWLRLKRISGRITLLGLPLLLIGLGVMLYGRTQVMEKPEIFLAGKGFFEIASNLTFLFGCIWLASLAVSSGIRKRINRLWNT